MNNQTEIWKDIPVYEGLYQVSSFGRVKSLSRTVYIGAHSKRIKPENIKIPTMSKKGYYCICLCDNGRQCSRLLHRLVAEAFILMENDYQNQVNHINGDKSDNTINNLEWVTRRENTCHCYLSKKPNINNIGISKRPTKRCEAIWYVSITLNKKRFHLGTFKSESEAILAKNIFYEKHNISNKYSSRT